MKLQTSALLYLVALATLLGPPAAGAEIITANMKPVSPIIDADPATFVGEWFDAAVLSISYTAAGKELTFALLNSDAETTLLLVGDIDFEAGEELALYFDQGLSGGSGDGILSGPAGAAGEFGFRLHGASGVVAEELSFNDAWRPNPNQAGYSSIVCAALEVGRSLCEISFPNSYEQLTADDGAPHFAVGDSIGFLPVIISGDEEYFPDSTNARSDAPGFYPGWYSIAIGSPPPIVGAIAAVDGPINVDGIIAGESAWNRAAEIPLNFTNGAGGKKSGILKIVEDRAAERLYLGLVIDETSGGELFASFDDRSAGGGRDGLLSIEDEDGFILPINSSIENLFFDGVGFSTEQIGGHYGAAADGDGSASFEAALDLRSAESRDLNLADDESADLTLIYTSEAGVSWRPIYGGAARAETGAKQRTFGGIAITSGAPFVQIITPAHDQSLSGIAELRAYSDGFAPTVEVLTWPEARPADKLALDKIGNGSEYAGFWSSFGLVDGLYLLRFAEQTTAPAIYRLVRVDNFPPSLSFFDIEPNPTPPGKEVKISFRTDELLSATPIVTVFTDRAQFVSQAGRLYDFRFTVPQNWDAGSYPVTVRIVDEAGNSVDIRAEEDLIVDVDPPQLAGEIKVKPLLAKIGDEISIDVEFTEEPATTPTVLVDQFNAEPIGQTGGSYNYRYLVTGEEKTGPIGINITATDRFGRQSTFSFNELYFDFTPPGFLITDISPNPAAPGERIKVTLSASEKLIEPPYVGLLGRELSVRFFTDDQFEYNLLIPESVTAGVYPMSVTATDPAGNIYASDRHAELWISHNQSELMLCCAPCDVYDDGDCNLSCIDSEWEEAARNNPDDSAQCCAACDYLDDFSCNLSCVPHAEKKRLSGGLFGCAQLPGETQNGDRTSVLGIFFLAAILVGLYRQKKSTNRRPLDSHRRTQ